ncbi:MFS transporter (plasmid) [Pseudonocardia bannensis]|uniref:Putative proline/betaine transporter n=1 Tax=Pseudonocardia bannensis TaxID=630973 RepID=A0A848DMV6_9PSEU|nr:MHS family MFS transporter [Pseudonocardia bannensis]
MTGSSRKVALGSFIGTTIEWYDFFLYGTASALIFSKLFFPSYEPLVGTLLSFATFGVAFLARPLGGIIFGHFGDRFGRKPMLVITLMMMGVATGAIGLLPTYETIGVAAPIVLVLLRILQGLSVGGEYGGAVLMTVEHAPPNRRGWYGSWVQAGSPAGLIISNAVFLLITTQVSQEQLLAWAWRIPFLASFVLVIVGIVIRLSLEESPAFQRVAKSERVETAPLVTVLRNHKRQVLLTAGAYVSTGVTVYLAAVFSLSYGTTTVGFSYSEMLVLVLLGQILAFVLMPTFSHVSDRVGHKRVFMIGIVGMALMAFPWLWLLTTGDFVPALLGFVLLFIPYSATYGTMAAFFAGVYETRIGYSGLSLGYQLGTVVGSALAPITATALVAATGTVASVGWYMVATAVLSLAAAIWLTSAVAAPVRDADSVGTEMVT